MVSVMGGEVSLKLPFTLMHTCAEFDPNGTLTRVVVPMQPHQEQVKKSVEEKTPTDTAEAVKPEKDGTWDEDKITVEINKDQSAEPKLEEKCLKQVTKVCNKVDKSPKQNLDEIITEKSEEVDASPVVVDRKPTVCPKEKGFSIQRVWCCLHNRRAS